VPAKYYLKDIKILATGNFTFLDYQPLDELKELAQTCSLALFPYVGEVYGSSGAVRLAMAWGLPVVTSKASLFDALKGVVLQGDIENNVRNILREYPTSQVKRQKNFIENHSWKSVAAEHLKLFGANEIPVEI
jgi:glycosyltransferase involved in cell wall biosynthesis